MKSFLATWWITHDTRPITLLGVIVKHIKEPSHSKLRFEIYLGRTFENHCLQNSTLVKGANNAPDT